MGGKKKLELPSQPEYWDFPGLSSSNTEVEKQINELFGVGDWLTDLDFGSHPLQETIDLSPQMTEKAFEAISKQLAPQIRDQQQTLINQLAANNQLESSVTADALSRFNTDITNQMQSYMAQAGMQDINRALSNRVDLYGMGINTTGSGIGMAQNQESMRNNFALKNYENQVAEAIANQDKGFNWGGAAMGAVGGALSGAMTPFGLGGVMWGALAGGLAGGFGGGDTGGQLMSGGAGLYGASLNPWSSVNLPNRTASDKTFSKTDTNLIGALNDNPWLYQRLNYGG